jgi:CRISPR-associated endonuclease/helicase Cas3
MNESPATNIFHAHSANDDGEWHQLNDHLANTAELSASFGRNEFEKDLFKYAGLLHDAGKYQLLFQEYLRNGGRRGSVPHAIHGAALSYRRAKPGQIRHQSVIFAVLGHHQGLLDWATVKTRLQEALHANVLDEVEKQLLLENPAIAELEKRIGTNGHYDKPEDFKSEFFTRYLFSALTDADWLDTESHFSSDKKMMRASHALDVDLFLEKLGAYLARISGSGKINELRSLVRKEAVSNADKPVGFFSLSVPTGLGKTLASMNWALEHARANSLKRVIVVLPFLNIIDQTAQIFSKIFGSDLILEHHSGFFDQSTNEENSPYNSQVLATENWDYPVIVTTTVQFFESLFSNRPSKCRKIHNIADSVVIFDEVQTLRQEVILPSLEMLRQVHEVLNTSFLFCTATQPAFEEREGFAGIQGIQPLITDPGPLFHSTKRVDYAVINEFTPVSMERLCVDISEQLDSVLIILNTKNDAKRVFEGVRSEGGFALIYHLSTNMCPLHRKLKIASVLAELKGGRKICLVSTQLIEAGVDVDFPIVYRALAPLESIIQAAGRCNREGKRPENGKVFLFRLEDGGIPPGLYSTCADHTRQLIEADITLLDRHGAFTDYYRQIQNLFVDGDRHKINEMRKTLKFKEVADCYKLISSDTVPLIVANYGEALSLLERLRGKPLLSRADVRKVQPYTVNFYQRQIAKYSSLIDQRTLPGIFIWNGKYDDDLGVITDDFSPEELIV